MPALRALPLDVAAVVVALADQPLVGAEAVARLIAAFRAGATVAVAAYEGKPRNPVLLAREHWPEVIATATGDQGARAFLRAHPDLVTLIECGDTGRPDDIDTTADLDRIAGHHRGLKPGLEVQPCQSADHHHPRWQDSMTLHDQAVRRVTAHDYVRGPGCPRCG